jgi:hypothetical protein
MSVARTASASGHSLDDCTAFNQDDASETAVTYTITSTCKVPIDCSVSWRVVCAPESKKRRAVHKGSAKFAFPTTDTKSTTANADVCGDDSFAIDSVNWSCQPNKE